MKVVESLTSRKKGQVKLKMMWRGPDGKKISAKEFFESLPEGTVLLIDGKRFPKLK